MKEVFWWTVIIIVLAHAICGTTPAAASLCLTKKEARELFPKKHLYWYSSDHCWSNRRGKPPSGLKIDPIIEKKTKTVDGNIANFRGKIEIARAEAPAAPATPTPSLPADLGPDPEPQPPPFVGEPMRMIMVPDYAVQKADKVPEVPEALSQPPAKPKPSETWLWLLSFMLAIGAAAFGVVVASLLKIYQPWRRKNVPTRNIAARSDNGSSPPRKRESSGSDGARNQQSYFHSWNLHRWKGRTEPRRHANDPAPVADRRDDFSALGAWSRRFGLCAESENNTDEPVSDRRSRKRIAGITW
jgi:hypothetical protein